MSYWTCRHTPHTGRYVMYKESMSKGCFFIVQKIIIFAGPKNTGNGSIKHKQVFKT